MKAKRVFAACGKAALYILFFFLMQFAASACTMIIGSVIGSVIMAFDELTWGGMTEIDPYIHYNQIAPMIESNALLAGLLLSAALTILFLFLFFMIRQKSFRYETGWHAMNRIDAVGPFALGFGLNVLVSLLLSGLPIPESWEQSFEEASSLLSSGSAVLSLLATVIAAPFAEELIFRGLVYTRLRRAMPRWIALVLSAAAFGVMHGTLLHLLYTIPLGILLGLVYDRFHSLWASILLHMGFNLAGSILSAVPAGWPLILVSVLLAGIGTAITLPERERKEPPALQL